MSHPGAHPGAQARPAFPPSGTLPAAPNRTFRVTLLMENSVTGRGVRAEHGLAYHVQVGGHSVLFDTGQSDLLVHNARELRLPLEKVDAIALSHGHYDHTGGLPALRRLAPQARLFLHPSALEPKFAGNPDGTSRPVGMADAGREAVSEAADCTWTVGPSEVGAGVFVTGEIPRVTDFEDTGGRFYRDPGCTQRDPLMDDQAMFFDTAAGVVVLLGCAHAGVVNTLTYIRQITQGRPIHTVLGGMHLLEAGQRRLDRTLACFRELNIQQLGPAHCTGLVPSARIRTEFGDRCVACSVGSSLVFGG